MIYSGFYDLFQQYKNVMKQCKNTVFPDCPTSFVKLDWKMEFQNIAEFSRQSI